MAVPYHACEHEIEYLCGYINDNGTIANYFGVPREIVVNVREKIGKKRNPSRFLDKRAEPLSTSSGLTSHFASDNDAITGSLMLNEAIQKLFRKFEDKHGLQAGAAQILLPAGWGGW